VSPSDRDAGWLGQAWGGDTVRPCAQGPIGSPTARRAVEELGRSGIRPENEPSGAAVRVACGRGIQEGTKRNDLGPKAPLLDIPADTICPSRP
jgi:hypothetical protein